MSKLLVWQRHKYLIINKVPLSFNLWYLKTLLTYHAYQGFGQVLLDHGDLVLGSNTKIIISLLLTRFSLNPRYSLYYHLIVIMTGKTKCFEGLKIKCLNALQKDHFLFKQGKSLNLLVWKCGIWKCCNMVAMLEKRIFFE